MNAISLNKFHNKYHKKLMSAKTDNVNLMSAKADIESLVSNYSLLCKIIITKKAVLSCQKKTE